MGRGSSVNRINGTNLDKKMHSWDLMRVDDLSKLLGLDPVLGFPSRKIYNDSKLPSDIHNEVVELFRCCRPLNNKNVKKLHELLMELIKTNKLCHIFNIQYSQWLNPVLASYIGSVSDDSSTLYELCTKYKGDDYKGVAVKANAFISKGTKLNFLLGFHKTIDENTRLFLESQKLDFSLMKSSLGNKHFIMLGPAAFINHDCFPNCEYESLTKTSIVIRTLRNIKTGEELFCFYGTDYFEEDNKECQCLTCESKKRRYFAEPDPNLDYHSAIQIHNIQIINERKHDLKLNRKIFNMEQIKKNEMYSITVDCCVFELYILIDKNCIANLGLSIICESTLLLKNYLANLMMPDKLTARFDTQNWLCLLLWLFVNFYFGDRFIKSITSSCERYNEYEKSSIETDEFRFESLAIEEINSDTHSKVATCQINPNQMKNLDNHHEPWSVTMQWCNKCKKGVVTDDVFEKWHSLDCSGTPQSRCNSNPLVLVEYPEPIPEKKKPFCIFCAHFVNQLPRHLENNHSNETTVALMLNARDRDERLKALASIRNRGHGVYYNYTGKIIPSRPIRQKAENVEKIQCACGNFFSKKTLWCHKCPAIV